MSGTRRERASEVGPPLKASNLKPGTVVVIEPPGADNVRFTFWVGVVNSKTVTFKARGIPGVGTWHVINFVRDDGEIIDDRGRVVRVYEYLGEP